MEHPLLSHVVVVGAGTMGRDVAVVFARGGARVTVVEPDSAKAQGVTSHVHAELQALGRAAPPVAVAANLDGVAWPDVGLVVECIVERLEPKQQLFAQLVTRAPAGALLGSNSSGIPISRIAEGLRTRERMFGLHFFMPAHLVPLVEVVLGPDSDEARAQALVAAMRACASVPVLERKDRPGFLPNRQQHALAREAFSLLDDGVASAQDIDAAVRFGFGFRFMAAGPVLQRDHAGLDIHAAAAATIYPSLCNDAKPAAVLTRHVEQGRLGMKTGAGFREWTDSERAAERARYERMLREALALLQQELPGRA
jgi:3-hydroxybutyryl-CoA dehydrogenase